MNQWKALEFSIKNFDVININTSKKVLMNTTDFYKSIPKPATIHSSLDYYLLKINKNKIANTIGRSGPSTSWMPINS